MSPSAEIRRSQRARANLYLELDAVQEEALHALRATMDPTGPQSPRSPEACRHRSRSDNPARARPARAHRRQGPIPTKPRGSIGHSHHTKKHALLLTQHRDRHTSHNALGPRSMPAARKSGTPDPRLCSALPLAQARFGPVENRLSLQLIRAPYGSRMNG